MRGVRRLPAGRASVGVAARRNLPGHPRLTTCDTQKSDAVGTFVIKPLIPSSKESHVLRVLMRNRPGMAWKIEQKRMGATGKEMRRNDAARLGFGGEGDDAARLSRGGAMRHVPRMRPKLVIDLWGHSLPDVVFSGVMPSGFVLGTPASPRPGTRFHGGSVHRARA